MKSLHHNFIILGSSWDLYKFAYSDLNSEKRAIYIPGIASRLNKIQRFLSRVHFTPNINKFVNLPFKNKWNSIIFKGLINDSDTIFVLHSGWMLLNENLGLLSFLKKKCPKARFVWFLQDLIDKLCTTEGKPIDIDKVKKELDLIISFDQGDCEKYGFDYHPLVFSTYKGDLNETISSDVYFLGQAKNRYDEIISAYEFFKKAGLRCDFHIAGVKKTMQKYPKEIDYNPHFSYEKNIQHILRSKCLLEVMQKGGVGLTQRGVEVVGLNKKLITNNPRIKEAPFYNSHFICQYSCVEDISHDFLERLKIDEPVDYQYKENLSPLELLYFIETKLDTK